MEMLNDFTAWLVGVVWGLPLVFVLLGAGIVFTFAFYFPQLRLFKHAIEVTCGKFDRPEDKGQISHFQALCAALSATIGLGNIAGVAAAITVGGPGAIFWMWVAGFFGMTTKFSSISLAMLYRHEEGEEIHGGPMYTIKNGLGPLFHPLAWMFSFFTIWGAIGAGNMFQANQIASIIKSTMNLPEIVTGIVFAVLTWLVIIGGIKRIGQVAGKLVPSMVVLYLVCSLGILIANYELLPGLFKQIFTDAFYGTAAVGGFTGVAFKEVLIHGIRRAMFSNEAGLGSAAIAHAAAKSNPLQEGLVGMLGPFIDTIVVCTITAMVILITGVWNQGSGQGVELTSQAFSTLYGGVGPFIIALVVVLFAFSSIISWCYYGEQGVRFLFGKKWILAYKWIFVVMVFVGAVVVKLDIILNFSDAVLGLMVVPNLLANLILSMKLKRSFSSYEKDLKEGRI